MECFKQHTLIDFMGQRRWSATLSAVLVILSVAMLASKGLNFGLDFTGGTLVEVRFEQAVDTEEIRDVLHADYAAKVSQVGTTGQDILVRLPIRPNENEQATANAVVRALTTTTLGHPTLRRVEMVGAEVGDQLAEQGLLAVISALLATLVYIALRFEYRFAFCAIMALIHDPILILGVFSAWQLEFDLATLAAILAVLGYSLNDTIVVYDRVRENFKKMRKSSTAEVLNASISQTLSRTIMTSLLTLLVVLALLVLGGESLKGFSVALTIGIVVGTYSSIYVAGALAYLLGVSRVHLFPPRVETKADQMP